MPPRNRVSPARAFPNGVGNEEPRGGKAEAIVEDLVDSFERAGFSRGVALRILESGLLLDAGFSLGSGTLLGVGENPYLRPLRARDRKTGLSSFDWSVGAVCTRLGMAMRPWDEVRCHHAEGAAEDGTYAMTHPASGGSARFLVEPGGVCGGL